jgi:hypothetical protein
MLLASRRSSHCLFEPEQAAKRHPGESLGETPRSPALCTPPPPRYPLAGRLIDIIGPRLDLLTCAGRHRFCFQGPDLASEGVRRCVEAQAAAPGGKAPPTLAHGRVPYDGCLALGSIAATLWASMCSTNDAARSSALSPATVRPMPYQSRNVLHAWSMYSVKETSGYILKRPCCMAVTISTGVPLYSMPLAVITILKMRPSRRCRLVGERLQI